MFSKEFIPKSIKHVNITEVSQMDTRSIHKFCWTSDSPIRRPNRSTFYSSKELQSSQQIHRVHVLIICSNLINDLLNVSEKVILTFDIPENSSTVSLEHRSTQSTTEEIVISEIEEIITKLNDFNIGVSFKQHI